MHRRLFRFLFPDERKHYDRKILRRGVRTPDAYEPDVLQRIGVEQAMDDAPLIVSADNNTGELISWCLDNPELYKQQHFIVADEQENFIGYIKKNNFSGQTKPTRWNRLLFMIFLSCTGTMTLGLRLNSWAMQTWMLWRSFQPSHLIKLRALLRLQTSYSITASTEKGRKIPCINFDQEKNKTAHCKGRLLMQPRKAQEEIG